MQPSEIKVGRTYQGGDGTRIGVKGIHTNDCEKTFIYMNGWIMGSWQVHEGRLIDITRFAAWAVREVGDGESEEAK